MSNEQDLKKLLSNRDWRIMGWGLYKIRDKNANIVPFKPNDSQIRLYYDCWYRNIIPKARQLWFSTLIEIMWLDYSAFNSNVHVWIIAQDRPAVQSIFEDKVKLARDYLWYNDRNEETKLSQFLKSKLEVSTENKNELAFSNWSRIKVGTSFRSGTLQFLHISEFGKICAKYPLKAKEIISWSIEAVPKDWWVFIESTAEWDTWYFYDYTMESKEMLEMSEELTPLDYKLHFFPWWENPDYTLENDVTIPKETVSYFRKLQEMWIELTDWQKVWYFVKSKKEKDEMKREYPSFLEEAFEVSSDWAYYKKEMTIVRNQNRICAVPYDAMLPVYAVWDLWWARKGSDDTAIRFFQTYGKEIRLINYWENSWFSIREQISSVLPEFWYKIKTAFWPHDGNVTEMSSWETRKRTAESLWLNVEIIPRYWLKDGIDRVKDMFVNCWFDKENTTEGIKHLNNYSKKRDNSASRYIGEPEHNEHSHCADSFRYLAWALDMIKQDVSSSGEDWWDWDWSTDWH